MKGIKAALYIITLLLLVSFRGRAQNYPVIDSLKEALETAADDTTKIALLFALGDQYTYLLPDSALYYFETARGISEDLDSPGQLALCLRNIGILKENQGLYDQALEQYFAALAAYEKTGNKQGIASCYNDIAIIHYLQKSYELCMEYLTKSFEIKKELGDKNGMSNYYNNMATVKSDQGFYKEAIDYTMKAIELYSEEDDKDGIATGYLNIGTINYNLGHYQAALENHLKSLEINREIDNRDGIAHSLGNIASTYGTMADSLARSDRERTHFLNEAVSYGTQAFQLAEELDALRLKNFLAENMLEIYMRLGNMEKAMDYAQIYMATRDSLFNEEKARAIEEMDTKYETEKKQQQIELQQSQLIARDATIRQQKTVRNALFAGLLAVVLIIIVVIYAYVQKRRDNRKITEQNAQILEANEELKVLNEAISLQNNEIVDSISYAQRIQSAMLPPESYLNELLEEVFILYRPRDIVSGDFYWIRQVGYYIIVAAADCTGHGVPGAFMSLLGISYLNEIVQRREITEANQVLNELRSQIKHSLRQHGQPDESKDGIDMAICVINNKDRTMQYAGAFNPLYLIREERGEPELIEIKADRMPLGYYHGKDRSFTNHEIKLEIGDTFYIFSDGYMDQKGGPDNKKFMSRNFKNLLLEVHEQPMFDQKSILEKKLADWMGSQSQIDDILVVGVRV